MMIHGLTAAPLWLAVTGIVGAWLCYIARPNLPGMVAGRLQLVYQILDHKYGFDQLYLRVFGQGSRELGQLLWQVGDVRLIDGILVNGTARLIGRLAGILRQLQTGYVYHYAFTMIIGLVLLSAWLLWR